MVLLYIKPEKYLLGGHFAKHNNSSAETRHFWVPAFCFQNAYVNFFKTFFYGNTLWVSEGYSPGINLIYLQ